MPKTNLIRNDYLKLTCTGHPQQTFGARQCSVQSANIFGHEVARRAVGIETAAGLSQCAGCCSF